MSASDQPVRRIVIVGGGVDGWMAAAVLAKSGLGASIEVLETPAGPAPRIGAALPGASGFHRFIGLAEDAALAAAAGAFSLGLQFEGWGGPGTSRFLPFGDSGASLDSVGFHHLLLRLERAGRRERMADYALAALAARAGRFSRPSEDPRSVLSTLDYGLHLDLDRYAEALRVHAQKAGVTRRDGRFVRADLHPDGSIDVLRLENGDAVTGELFLDCTGPDASLIGHAMGVAEEIWDGLPFDRLVETVCETKAPPEPFARIVADDAGWLRILPIQGRSGLSYCYAGSVLDEAAAGARLATAAGAAPGAKVRHARVTFGRRAEAWRGNCIALGGAAGSPGLLLGAELRLVQTGLSRLITLFPFAGDNAAAAAEYNRLTAAEAERLRDFTLLQVRTNGRAEPVWKACREAPLPGTLALRMRLFESRARTPMLEEETFPETSWAAVLLDQGVRPRRYDAMADAMPTQDLDAILARMKSAMVQAVQAMPTHEAALAAVGRPSRELLS
jgi:tryptophan halogenase